MCQRIPHFFGWKGRPITKIEDMKGLKIRVIFLVAVSYALVSGALYRRLTSKDVAECFVTSCKTSAVVFMLLATAKVASFILVSYQFPQKVAQFFLQKTTSPDVFLVFTIVFLLMV